MVLVAMVEDISLRPHGMPLLLEPINGFIIDGIGL